ncbi:MAG: hypothetical protein ABI165_07295, partial [Bryobacteraceae bacterium]
SSDDRTLGRFTSGAPRIAPLYTDLNPAVAPQPLHVVSEAGRFVVTWLGVPVYSDSGFSSPQTFQVRLYPDGHIEFAYQGVSAANAVVGISPGNLTSLPALVSFTAGSTQTYSGPVAEVFAGDDSVDIVTAAQKFYQAHDDAYDYLVFYNAEAIPASAGSVSYEVTVRNNRSGYGDVPVEDGPEYGSMRRLQAVLNMGPLSEYPADPNGRVQSRFTTGDTPLSILSHETGHLFLAYASIRDANDPAAMPMLSSPDFAHWNFSFNSEASFMGGNLIADQGAGAAPRFLTTGAVSQYAPLDQYLMGFRAPEDVAPTFLVTNSTAGDSSRLPEPGVAFDGQREDIAVEQVAAVVGRRTPDSTVAQRHFRFAFVLIVPAGSSADAAQLAQLDAYRAGFEPYYATAASQLATADTALKHALHFSGFPAVGVLQGAAAAASVTIEQPAAAALTLTIQTANGVVAAPAMLQIPAGATNVKFQLNGVKAGVEDLTVTAADASFETVFSRVEVLGAESGLHLSVVQGGQPNAPVVVQVVDVNNLPYPNVRVLAAATGVGAVQPAAAVSDESGLVSFQWMPGGSGPLRLSLDGVANSAITVMAISAPVINLNGVANAASYAVGLAPGEIASIFGANLAVDPRVLIDGASANVFYASDGQINFLAPATLAPGTAAVVVSTSGGVSAAMQVPVTAIAPGIFFDTASGLGAVLIAGTGLTTAEHPAAAGDALEIYATGLGTAPAAAQVTIGGTLAQVLYSGPAPGFPGLSQINAVAPDGLASGAQNLELSVSGVPSNVVKILLQ